MKNFNNEGYVYIIADYENEAYKIGVTRNLISKRMKQLQTGNSNDLQLIKSFKSQYPFKLESLLHRRFSYKRIQNEWFALDKSDIDNFESICNISEQNFEMLEKMKQEELFFNNLF